MPDIPDEVLDEVERVLSDAGVILHRVQDSATRDCMNASASHPLRKNYERWRARCVLAGHDAATSLARLRAAREVK